MSFRSAATLVLFSFVHFAGAAEVATPPVAPPSDQTQAVGAVERMYVAFTNEDLALFHSVVAPGFYAFDGGKRFEGDALMDFIKALHASGKVYVWRVTDPSVQLYGDTALITYLNKGSLKDQSGKKDLLWLESAILRKEEGTWRIRFFHSTRVP